MIFRLGRALAIFVTGVLVASLVQAAMGATVQTAGGAINQVKVVTDGAEQTLHGAGVEGNGGTIGWSNIQGARTTMQIPGGWNRGLVIARFTGQFTCRRAVDFRILIGSIEAAPVPNLDVASDSFRVDFQNSGMEIVTMDRTRGNLPPGTYAVQVQWALDYLGTSETCSADDWSLIAERSQST